MSKKKSLKQERYCIVRDDSGHDYFIPSHLFDQFEEWAYQGNEDLDDVFEPLRCNCHPSTYTFTDIRDKDGKPFV